MKRKIFIVILLLLGILIAIIMSLRVSNIKTSGNQIYTDEEIQDIVLSGSFAHNSVYLYLFDRLGEKQNIPFIQEYKIVWESPFDIEIIVYEKSIVAAVEYMDTYMYFDKDGIVVDSSASLLEGIPVVQGLEYESVVLYKAMPVKDEKIFYEILTLTQILYTNNLFVEEIIYCEDHTMELKIGDIQVILGTNEDIDGKVAELKDMFFEIQGLSGTLYLDNYDILNDKSMYTFKKR